jgi:hypothetical protein
MKNHHALVLAGLALLLAAGTGCNSVSKQAQNDADACGKSIKTIGTALEMYTLDNDSKFPSSLDRLMPAQLKAVPTCPAAKKATYQIVTSPDAKSYTVVCAGGNHQAAGIKGDFPQFTSSKGYVPK